MSEWSLLKRRVLTTALVMETLLLFGGMFFVASLGLKSASAPRTSEWHDGLRVYTAMVVAIAAGGEHRLEKLRAIVANEPNLTLRTEAAGSNGLVALIDSVQDRPEEDLLASLGSVLCMKDSVYIYFYEAKEIRMKKVAMKGDCGASQ